MLMTVHATDMLKTRDKINGFSALPQRAIADTELQDAVDVVPAHRLLQLSHRSEVLLRLPASIVGSLPALVEW